MKDELISKIPGAPMKTWLTGGLPKDAAELLQRMRIAKDVFRIAVMPDVHAADDVCVGTVLATEHLLYPSAVGGDIGCGISAIALDADASVLSSADRAAAALDGLRAAVPSNRHRLSRLLPISLTDLSLSDSRLESVCRRDANVQLGTLGRGNHFVELQSDESNRLWLMIHSGSRCVGRAVRDIHLSNATIKSGRLLALDSRTTDGQAYLNDAQFARIYACENRRAMMIAVTELLRNLFAIECNWKTHFDIDHNHMNSEEHFGKRLWVHRKGAAPAFDGQNGAIPGSMGTCSYHVIGRGNSESMCSSSHGAGRAMKRSDAMARIGSRELIRQMHGIWFDPRMTESLRDEAPSAYKDIRRVMRAQSDLIKVVRILKPLLVYKGS